MPRRIAHETLGVQKHAVNPADFWEFQPGERVIADGFPGVISAVNDGPYPGVEFYDVTLDNGAGGGEYTAAQLTRPGSVTASFIATDTTDDDNEEPSDSLSPVEAGSTALANHWYPELGSILTDRPPIEREGLGRTASLTPHLWSFQPGQKVLADGIPGYILTQVDPRISQAPGAGQLYRVVLANGMGEGEFFQAQLQHTANRVPNDPEDLERDEYGAHGYRECEHCGNWHPAGYSHEGNFGEGHIFEVSCPEDGMSEFVTAEGLHSRTRPKGRRVTGAAIPPDAANEDGSEGLGNAFDSSAQPDVCSWCGNPGPWDGDVQDTGRGTRVRCGTCGGTMRLNSDPVASTSGIQWQPEFPNSPQNAPSRMPDPRSRVNDLSAVHGSLNPVASQQAGYPIFHAPEAQAQALSFLASTIAAGVDDDWRFHFTASWRDVQEKAKRIRSEAGVRLTVVSSAGAVGEVQGDNGIYESEVVYVPGSRKIAYWNCGCKWGAYAWGRSPAYKRFEGRACSHNLALRYEVTARSMFGQTAHPDNHRLDQQHPHTPVTVQHQRPTDRHPGGDINRRTVPPGNMRTQWDPNSRVRVKGSLVDNTSAMHDWARFLVSMGTPPSQVVTTLQELSVPHQLARAAVRWATSSDESTEITVQGALARLVDVEGELMLLDDGRVMPAREASLRQPVAMAWSEHGGMSAEEAGAKSVRHAGFRGYVGGGDGDDFEIEGQGKHDEFDEDLHERTAPEPTHEEQAHYDEHDEYPDSYYDRHDQAYGEALDAKRREDDPDLVDEHLHHFISEHGSDGALWKEHAAQPQRVDLTRGVWANQSHVGQKHIDKYLADPNAGVHKPSHYGDYLGDGHPLFVTHEGRLHAIEGHHRVGSALQRGDNSMEGYHYDLDTHPVPVKSEHNFVDSDEEYYGHSGRCPDCHYHHVGKALEPGDEFDHAPHTASWHYAATADEDGGQDDPAQSIPGLYSRDQTKRKKKHPLHHTNDAREHAHNFGYGLPWGGSYVWCDQCSGSGCGHCGGTGQVAVGQGLLQNASDNSSTESPVSDQSADAGSMIGDTGGGMSATGALAAIDQESCPHNQGVNLHGQCKRCGYIPHTEADDPCDDPWCVAHEPEHTKGEHMDPPHLDPGHPDYHSAEHEIERAIGNHPDAWLFDHNHTGPTHLSSVHTADYSSTDFSSGAADQQTRPATPVSNSDNPASTGFATSADPNAWVNPVVQSGFNPSWEAARSEEMARRVQELLAGGNFTRTAAQAETPTHAGVALKANDTGRVLMIQRSNQDEKDPARGTWEFPGGGREDGDLTSLHTGIREFEEEVGHPFPEGGHLTHVHRSGPYVLHVVNIPEESAVDFSGGRRTVNPDDPDGDDHEQSAWWDPEHAKKNPALREECKSSPWSTINKAAGWNYTQQDMDSGPDDGPIVHTPGQVPPRRLRPGDQLLWGDGGVHHINAATFNLLHVSRPDGRFPKSMARAPIEGDSSNVIGHEGSLDRDAALLFLGELHDEPEGALPSTDGADPDGDLDQDQSDEVDTEVGDTVVPGVDTQRSVPWGYPESAADHPNAAVAQPGSADVNMDPSADPSPDLPDMKAATAALSEDMQLAAQFNPVIAAFQRSAGFAALVDGHKPVDSDGMGDSDIAKAARMHLAKVAAKNFSFAEQQELIGEGNGTVRARNFNKLRIEGTHYERLGEDEAPDDEFLWL